jgi:thioredoxin reductase
VGVRHIAVLGAGPIGLEAALAARQAGHECTVYEAGEVGGNVRAWGHVRLFTPWSMNVSPRAARALGARAPHGPALPTGGELADELLEPLARLPELEGVVQRHTRVVGVAREGLLKHEAIGHPTRRERSFRVLVEDPDGVERVDRAEVVIDATGTSGNPNRLGDGGIEAVGERALGRRIVRAIPDLGQRPGEWAGRTTLLVGSGHSAQTAARDLAALARHEPLTRVIWAVRSAEPTWGAVDDDPLGERAALNAAASGLLAGESPDVSVRAGTTVEALHERAGRVSVTLRNGEADEVEVDRILSLVGGAPDADLYRQLQVQECYATLGPIRLAAALLGEAPGGDCLAQVGHGPETLRNPEPDFFILGAKSYGRNSQFLLGVGWRQVDDVFESLL